MLSNANLQLGLFVVVLLALAKPMGIYMARVADGDAPWLARLGGPFERLIYRAAGVDPRHEMNWKTYALALLLFNVVGLLALYLLQRVQAWLPLNPQGLPNVGADSAFNTAVSFTTNTSWQGYTGETTLGYLVQMLGITVKSFLSAASGIAVLFALIRGFARRNVGTPGNLWADLTRATLYLLVPLSMLFSVAFMAQGVIQNFSTYQTVHTLQANTWQQPKLDAQGNPLHDAKGTVIQETVSAQQQLVAMGPVASQESIKLLSGDGAVNAMHDSFSPLGGLVPMALMQTGEVVFGGPGSGLFSMIVDAMLAVFLAGLMIGRKPEYLGKKIDAYEMKMVALVVLATPFLVLVGTAISVLLPAGVAGIANPGAHGFSEILYAFSSAANNNGSAFAGLSANTPHYNVMLAIAMWFGRFAVIVPVLAIAGSLAPKLRRTPGAGTLPTHGPLFIGLPIGTVVMVASLTYLPALALGPIAEQLTMATGH